MQRKYLQSTTLRIAFPQPQKEYRLNVESYLRNQKTSVIRRVATKKVSQ